MLNSERLAAVASPAGRGLSDSNEAAGARSGEGGRRLSHPPVKLGSMKQMLNSERSREASDLVGTGLAILDEEVAGAASREEMEELAGTVKRIKARLSSLETAIAWRLSRAEGKREAAEVLQEQMGMTGHQAKSLAKVSEGLAEMPNTRAKLEAGEITFDHATSLTNAARQCGAKQVDADKGLLAEAAEASPDDFRRRSRQWTADNSRDRGEDELRRQRARRKAFMFWDAAQNMGVLHAELDRIAYGQVKQALDRGADRLRRADSGGEVHPDNARSNDQRRADALFELLTGRDAETLQPLPGTESRSGGPVTQLVVVADTGVLDGSRPQGRCEVLGTGPVPPSILGDLSPDTSLSGIIFGGKGRVLWLGRGQRLGNVAQRLAAAVRDGGCVRCDIPVHQTELHHLRDWYDGGPTDIDNLVSLCGPHHRQLQDRNLELVKVGKTWKTRPRPGASAPPSPPFPARTGQPPIRAGPLLS